MKPAYSATRVCFLLVSLFAGPAALAQNREPMPTGGLHALALVYYKIEFSPAQRKLLEGVAVEFIYDVDTLGNARLEKVNGITDEAILDSLYDATPRLPKFIPMIVDGKIQPTLFFMQIRFPVYAEDRSNAWPYDGAGRYTRLEPEDFDYIEKSGRRMDMTIGGLVNTHLGNAHQYLKTGGGLTIQFMFNGTKGWGWGLVMNFYGNGKKKEYPISSQRDQNNAPPTLLLGTAISRSVFRKDRQEFIVQVDANYAVHNVVPKDDKYDDDYVQFQGFSPGVSAHYAWRLGKERLAPYLGKPAFVSHHIEVQAAVRPLFMNRKEASGVMVEVGVAYRMSMHPVRSYKVKREFFR